MTVSRLRIRAWGRVAGEMILLFALLFGVDHLWCGGTGFADLHVNPYWIPVIVMALAYGTGAGFVAAVIASILWISAAGLTLNDQDYFARIFAISLPPLLWYIGAILIGEVTAVRRNEIARLSASVALQRRNMERVVTAFDQLSQQNRVLQTRIATEDQTLSEGLAVAGRLHSAVGPQRTILLGDLVAMACRTRDFTCYSMVGARPIAVLKGSGPITTPDIKPRHPLLAAVRFRRTIIHAAKKEDRPLLDRLGLMAVPLMRDGVDQPEALLFIHTLPFENLNALFLTELSAMGGWLVPLLDSILPARNDALSTERFG